MKKKNTYRSMDVQKVDAVRLLAMLPAALVVIGIDVAKRRQVAAVCDPQGIHQLLVHFEHPQQTPAFMNLLVELKAQGRKVQVVMEPTGTYGDILCHEAERREVEVFMVNPQRTHDAAQVFDGVPSYHDAKDATLAARLHAQGASRRWKPTEAMRREMRALVTRRELHARQQESLYGELEGLLARYWPEFEKALDVRRQRSALAMLAEYPDPRLVAASPMAAKEALHRASRGKLKPATCEVLVVGAQQTLGVAMLPAERELLKEVASEILRLDRRIEEFDGMLAEQLKASPKLAQAASWVGLTTMAVVYTYMGDPNAYGSPGALLKAMGLNLREASSGETGRRQFRPGVHITKRGPGIVRKYMYMATLRWLQEDATAQAWYKARIGYTPTSKVRAVVALMRKLVRGLWHLSRGARYEAERLFDVRRLKPTPALSAGVEKSEVTM